MGKIVLVELQRPGERGEHLRRRARITTLFETHEIIDADAGERRQLGPTQSRCAATRSGRQARRRPGPPIPAAAQEAAELALHHDSQSASPAGGLGGPVGTSINTAFPGRRPAASWEP